MQYPELNIGEFARKHSANVELEKHENEEGYLLMVDVEGEYGYPVSIGARPQTSDEVGKLYENQFEDFTSDELVAVYGSDEAAIESLRGNDAWARFEAPGEFEDSYEVKGWALDIEPLIARMKDSQYKEIMREIAASTLYVVDRAESNGEVGTGLLDFHRDLVREFMPGETEPIVIDVVDETETASEYVELEREKSGKGSNEEELLEESEPGTLIDYDEIVSGTISESKSRIEEIEERLTEEDWKALLEAEKEGYNRVTFKPYLEEHLEEDKEDT